MLEISGTTTDTAQAPLLQTVCSHSTKTQARPVFSSVLSQNGFHKALAGSANRYYQAYVRQHFHLNPCWIDSSGSNNIFFLQSFYWIDFSKLFLNSHTAQKQKLNWKTNAPCTLKSFILFSIFLSDNVAYCILWTFLQRDCNLKLWCSPCSSITSYLWKNMGWVSMIYRLGCDLHFSRLMFSYINTVWADILYYTFQRQSGASVYVSIIQHGRKNHPLHLWACSRCFRQLVVQSDSSSLHVEVSMGKKLNLKLLLIAVHQCVNVCVYEFLRHVAPTGLTPGQG